MKSLCKSMKVAADLPWLCLDEKFWYTVGIINIPGLKLSFPTPYFHPTLWNLILECSVVEQCEQYECLHSTLMRSRYWKQWPEGTGQCAEGVISKHTGKLIGFDWAEASVTYFIRRERRRDGNEGGVLLPLSVALSLSRQSCVCPFSLRP